MSKFIVGNGYWERQFGNWTNILMESDTRKRTLSTKRAKAKNVLFIDLGANIGTHGLYAAALGAQVWAIEPQERNIVKVTRSSQHNVKKNPSCLFFFVGTG